MVTRRRSLTALGPAQLPPDTKIASRCLENWRAGELENRGWGLENSGSGGGREMSTLAHQSGSKLLELETKVRVFAITENAPTRAFSLLKVLTSLVLCM